ncbi:MAG: tRNA dihydrouridine synthase DusB [Clostridia bacterium]|nr:tRNA dihydrouridine synthase DusB [Clostridia bacterium]MBR1685956.1 tRNA dihydrouridine synthase DusB [Clostridia bacterium]
MREIRLAPLAGVTDWPFRKLCFEQGCDCAYTEMVSATGFVYAPQAEATRNLLYRAPSDQRLILQLFGNNPEHMYKAASILSATGDFDGIDINMGCPVHKVAASGQGSGLMRTPELAEEVMRAAVRASHVPVSVKMRLGWDAESLNYLELCHRAEDAGIASVAIHGRTRVQMYAGEADWDAIAKAAETVSIPVYGNGDIFTGEDAAKRLANTAIAGLLVARGAMGNPWIFRQIHDRLSGKTPVMPSTREKVDMALAHAMLLMEWKSENVAIREMRKHIGWYLHGVRGAAFVRTQVNRAETIDQIRELLESVCASEEVRA